MTVDGRIWRIGMIGVSPFGLFLLERMSLHSGIQVVGVFDPDPVRRRFALEFGCETWDRPNAAFESNHVDVVFLMDFTAFDPMSNLFRKGQNVVLDRWWRLSPALLQSLHDQLQANQYVGTAAAVRRGSADFVSALSVKQTRRLGTLQFVNLTSCEQLLPGEEYPEGLMREFGVPWIDQLLVLVESAPRRVFAQRFHETDHKNETGFVATIEFANASTAQIEIRTRTRISHRTGWILEGSIGSYRGERLFTTTADGEIVDESLNQAPIPNDSYVDELVSTWRGECSNLPTLAHAARVVQLIETLERSADTGQVVSL